jgi:hypothetical protein
VAATVIIGSLGVPMSARRVSRNGEAFPCQDCACGCSSAEACWRNCCCFTNAQKVVWAERNGVKVPVYVMAAARREQAKASSQAVASASCASKSCCSTGASCCDQESAPSQQQDTAGKAVLLISALKCRGISLSVGILPPAIPARPIAWGASRPEAAWRPSSPPSLYRSPVFDVATPPPNVAA